MRLAQQADTGGGIHALYDEGIELFLKQIFAHATIGLAILNPDTRLVYVNPAFSTITGFKAKELRQIRTHDLTHADDRQHNTLLRDRLLAGKIPGYVIEKRYIHKDGSIGWVKNSVALITDQTGKPIHILALVEDMDEHHWAEDAVKESKTRLRFASKIMSQKVFTASPSGTLDYLSPQWAYYTGLNTSDMDDQFWSHIVHPDDAAANQIAWRHAKDTGLPYYFEHRLRRTDGTYHWHISQALALYDEQGRISKWIGSATDVEELKRVWELQHRFEYLAQQHEELLAMDQAKDEFILLAAHQLRTPATGIKQNIGLLLDGYEGTVSDRQREVLQTALDCNERQIKLIDNLLRVTRLDAGHVQLSKQSVDLAGLIGDVIKEQRHSTERRDQRITFIPPKIPVITDIDAELIHIVLENLLDNASKYSESGSTITVSLTKSRAHITLAVADHGVGIDAKNLQKLFQKFSRIDNPLSSQVSGTGVGLWAKRIVELHGGTLTAVSKIGHGSTFSIRLATSAKTHPN